MTNVAHSRPRSPEEKQLCALAIIAIFVGLGPLIGLFGVAGLSYVLSPLIAPTSWQHGVLRTPINGGTIWICYLIGGLPALVTGLVIAYRAFRQGHVAMRSGATVSALAGALFCLGVMQLVGFFAEFHQDPSKNLPVLLMPAFYVVAAVFAGGVCTHLTRRWH